MKEESRFNQFQVFRNGVSVGFTEADRGPTKEACVAWLKHHTIGLIDGSWQKRGGDGYQFHQRVGYVFDFERPQ